MQIGARPAGGRRAEKQRGRSARWWRRSALLVIGVLVLGQSLACSMFSVPRYRGPLPREAHFDGKRFRNQVPTEAKGFWDLMKWQFSRERGSWRAWTDAEPGPPPPEEVGPGELRVTFINHATTLVQMDGLNILTDPVWSESVGPASWLGVKRVRPPGLRFEDLPQIHVVAISHNHYDHLDLPTLQRLAEVHGPRFFVGLGNKDLLNEARIVNTVELDWWQQVELRSGVKLSFVPAQHRSNRGLADENHTLWGGYVFEGSEGYVYFAGDTGFGPHFAQIRERFGPPRLAILPIGAFQPEWFMQGVHVSPSESVRAHQIMDAHRSVAMHYGTFRLADDGQDAPIEHLQRALAQQGVPADHFWTLDFGEGRQVSPLSPTTHSQVD